MCHDGMAKVSTAPNTVAVGIIKQLNTRFIDAGVKFVIQIGDLTDTGAKHKDIIFGSTPDKNPDAQNEFYRSFMENGVGYEIIVPIRTTCCRF